jgi:hypothetical protein
VWLYDIEYLKIDEKDCIFMAGGEFGMTVFDVTDPNSIVQINGAETLDRVRGLSLVNDRIYLAEFASISAFTVDPETIFEEDMSLAGYFKALYPSQYLNAEILGDFAYIASGNGGLEVLDVSNPDSLTQMFSLKGRIKMSGFCSDVHLHGSSHALLAAGYAGIQIVDINDLDDLMLVGTYPSGDFAMGLTGNGDLLGLANYYGGFQFIDFTAVTNPVLEGEYVTPGAIFDVKYLPAGDSSYLYAIDSNSDLHIINCTDPSDPLLLTSLEFHETPQHILLDGGYLYVASGHSGLTIYRMEDPETPTFLSSIYITGFIYDISKFGDLIYATLGEDGVHVIDVTNPENPVLLDEYNTLGFAWHAVRNGNYLYVASGEEGIVVLNSMKEDSLSFHSTTPTEGNTLKLAAEDDVLFAAELTRCATFSLESDDFMDELSTWDREFVASELMDLSLNIPYVYLAAGYNGIVLLSTSLPDTMFLDIEERYVTPGFTHAIDLYGNLALIADNFSVMILDPEFTDVAISSFSARVVPEGIRLSWHNSESSRDIQVNVYRSVMGDTSKKRLNAVPIRGESFVDREVLSPGRYSYWLEEAGSKSVYGPVTVFVQTPGAGRISLLQNDPNPFNPFTTIRFSVNDNDDNVKTFVKLNIYNTKGELVKQLVEGKELSPGEYSVSWNGENEKGSSVPSGVYWYRLEVNDSSQTKKMILLK